MLKIVGKIVIVDFGKYKGKPIADVPVDYLQWALREITDMPDEETNLLREELHRRDHEGVLSFDF